MAAKRKIRRKLRRNSPAVRRAPDTAINAARSEAKNSGLMVGGAHDPAEKAADRMATKALGAVAGSSAASAAGPVTVHRHSTSSPSVAPGTQSGTVPKAAADAVNGLGTGRGLNAAERGYFEPRFGHNFSSVRLHEGAAAHQATTRLGAQAFALGHDIAFSEGAHDRFTMAHELAHVMQDGNAARRTLRRDLAIEPANPGTVAAVLTPEQHRLALLYNQRRFEDPFTIRIIRDVFGGISDVPAVINDDFINATLQWQAERNLGQDGKFGPVTTRAMVRELTAEGEGRLARLLRSDNFVRIVNIGGPTFPAPPNPPVDFMGFRWDVAFRTSLRNGFIVQRVRNVWNEIGAPAPRRINAPTTPGYWEAWPINGAGNITHPKHPTGADDRFQRAMHSGTRGNWRMTGTLYTVLNLPAMFTAPGGAAHAPDAGGLQATINNPGSDNLGLPEGFTSIEHNEASRTIRGSWDVTNANPALHVNRRN
jgi:hypothetical protein